MPLVREIELSCEPQTNSDELSPIGNKFKYHARRFLNVYTFVFTTREIF